MGADRKISAGHRVEAYVASWLGSEVRTATNFLGNTSRPGHSDLNITPRDRLDQLPDVLPLRRVANAVVRPRQLERLV